MCSRRWMSYRRRRSGFRWSKKIGANAKIAAGAVVAQSKVIPSGQLWAGVPASYQRDLTVDELEKMVSSIQEWKELAVEHAKENAKSWETIEDEEYNYEQRAYRDENYYTMLTPEEMSKAAGEFEGHTVPGRLFNSEVSASFSAPANKNKQ